VESVEWNEMVSPPNAPIRKIQHGGIIVGFLGEIMNVRGSDIEGRKGGRL
jgi:hypothetical protein